MRTLLFHLAGLPLVSCGVSRTWNPTDGASTPPPPSAMWTTDRTSPQPPPPGSCPVGFISRTIDFDALPMRHGEYSRPWIWNEDKIHGYTFHSDDRAHCLRPMLFQSQQEYSVLGNSGFVSHHAHSHTGKKGLLVPSGMELRMYSHPERIFTVTEITMVSAYREDLQVKMYEPLGTQMSMSEYCSTLGNTPAQNGGVTNWNGGDSAHLMDGQRSVQVTHDSDHGMISPGLVKVGGGKSTYERVSPSTVKTFRLGTIPPQPIDPLNPAWPNYIFSLKAFGGRRIKEIHADGAELIISSLRVCEQMVQVDGGPNLPGGMDCGHDGCLSLNGGRDDTGFNPGAFSGQQQNQWLMNLPPLSEPLEF